MMARFFAALSERSAVSSRATAVAILLAMCSCTHLAFCQDSYHTYQMMEAVLTGDSGKVQEIIKHDPNLVFTSGGGWQTPLHLAAFCGFPNVVELLLAHNALVNETNNQGWTPLHYAANYSDETCRSSSAISHVRVVRLLLAKSAFVDYPDSGGRAPLHLASEKGLKDVMQLLLASGANPNLEDSGGCTPLHLAVFYEHLDIIGLLLSNHVDVNAESKSKGCGTPLMAAAARGYMEGAELLLANGAHVNSVNAEGGPLCEATSGGYTQMVSLLLANKADVNHPCGPRQTPLYKAKFHRHDDTAELLRLHGGTSDYVRPPVKKKP